VRHQLLALSGFAAMGEDAGKESAEKFGPGALAMEIMRAVRDGSDSARPRPFARE
jgi:hypothetical protein